MEQGKRLENKGDKAGDGAAPALASSRWPFYFYRPFFLFLHVRATGRTHVPSNTHAPCSRAALGGTEAAHRGGRDLPRGDRRKEQKKEREIWISVNISEARR